MTDRYVFLTSFLTAVLIVAGAFALPPFFYYELAKSTIFVAIAVLVFYGNNRFSYMLGIVAPIIWYIASIVMGSLFTDFRILFQYFSPGQKLGPMETPLHALSLLAALALIIASWSAWRREVPEKFAGKTLWASIVVSLIYAVILSVWYLRAVHA